MPEYAAFLRGINVGGHHKVPMPRLKRAFETLGFKDVRTILASGNVLFQSAATGAATIQKKIEEKLRTNFGFEISVMLRSLKELRELSESRPFKGVTVTPQTRLYVTFLSGRSKEDLRFPFKSLTKDFVILAAQDRNVFSVVTLSASTGTLDLMDFLEKEFGTQVTTRNWNTVEKILK